MFKLILLIVFADAVPRITSHPLLQAVPQKICPAVNNPIPVNKGHLPNNIPVYPHGNTFQNPIHIYKEPSLAKQISDMFLDGILSDPGIKTILEQNAKIDAKTCNDKPTIINNYIIVPKEYLDNCTKDKNINTKDTHDVESDKTKKTVKKQRSKDKKGTNARRKTKNKGIPKHNDELDPNFINETNTNDERGKRNLQNGLQATAVAPVQGIGQLSKKNSRSGLPHNVLNNPKPLNSFNNFVTGNEIAAKFQNTNNEMSPTCKAREENMIAELRSKYPSIPEDVIKGLLKHLKNLVHENNEKTTNNIIPNFNSPFMYDQFFQNAMYPSFSNVDNKENTRNRRPKSSRRNKNKRRKPKNSSNSTLTVITTEITPDLTASVASTENEIETEAIYPVFVKESYPLHSNEESERAALKTVENSDALELGNEDNNIVPFVHRNNIRHDYHLDLTADTQTDVGNNEDGNRNQQNDKYHYTTDKSVEFRTPPSLERPDFITKADKRKVKEEREFIENIADKTSNYFTNIDKENIKESPKGVYTHVVQSKVKKYGSNVDEKTGNVEAKFVEDDFENPVQFNSRGDMIVIAHTMNESEEFR